MDTGCSHTTAVPGDARADSLKDLLLHGWFRSQNSIAGRPGVQATREHPGAQAPGRNLHVNEPRQRRKALFSLPFVPSGLLVRLRQEFRDRKHWQSLSAWRGACPRLCRHWLKVPGGCIFFLGCTANSARRVNCSIHHVRRAPILAFQPS